jgi:hypothetical protein
MRIAAGIILIIYGVVSLVIYVFVLHVMQLHLYLFFDPSRILLFIISKAFIVTGGVFCLMRKVWGLCFASALLSVSINIYEIAGLSFLPLPSDLWIWWSLIIITGALPIIFICIRKREWSESQA